MTTSTQPPPPDQPATAAPTEPGVHPDHDRGLEFDVRTLLCRRAALGLVGGAGLALLTACADGAASAAGTLSASASASAGASASATATSSATSTTVDVVVPSETAGPYPGDGSNGKDVLDDAGIVRRDIRSSIGSSTTAAGAPLTVNLTVLDSTAGYAALEGVAVYAWHADAQGRYSMYSQGVEGETYLRGVQPTDASGTATFTTVFPGCYDGRWPHVHFEVYRSTAEATSDGQIVRTSQIALPEAACRTVYADTATYPSSTSNLERTSLTSDNVFGDDGGIHQLATVTGDATSGFVANLTVAV